ncbi:hypothetical protein [Mucilaginibacter myungsuensis]|uniref:Lipoprotein n=1 Tax=Mucilaginibacter myungsuensis TaxID=649104 RepID=A0A929L123_9SPHI|nr:hypothetical protein [Mucilaginibacter myungsuensis]MBE9662160.1 hypothetical protein [Mucilaginibacter myungsuensis]MDN3599406.1 hypothetical protein [Mucilaginibacter myungsuensis]
MLNIKRILLAGTMACALLATTGCKKSDNGKRRIIEANGTIVNAGPVAADGCGYLLMIDGEQYHADNFQGMPNFDNKKVILDAIVTGERFHCGWSANSTPGLAVIHITKMITL